MKGYTIRAWAGSARRGRCRYCRGAIVWVTTEPGGTLPFDRSFTIREVVRHPVTGARFLVLHRDDRHVCARTRQPANNRSQRGRSV